MTFNIYHGLDRPQNIDWQVPVASVNEHQESVAIHLSLAAGRRHVLGVRRVSASGLDDGNTHMVQAIQINAAGEMVPALNRPAQVRVSRGDRGTASLSFVYEPAPGSMPDCFDILDGAVDGEIDLGNPLASLRAWAGQRAYSLFVASSGRPQRLAVRARCGLHVGPLSEIVLLSWTATSAPAAFQEVLS